MRKLPPSEGRATSRLPAILLALFLMPGAAEAGTRVATRCQRSLDDGRLLAIDGRFLPVGARFRVVGYRPQSIRDGWSSGPCVLDVAR